MAGTSQRSFAAMECRLMLRMLIAAGAVALFVSATAAQAGQCAVPSELSRLATYASADPLARIVARSSPVKLQAAVTCGPYCDLSVGGTTPQGAAAGSTCAIAHTNLDTLLRSYASTACGGLPCQVKTYSACQLQPDGTNYLAVGYATYGCRDSTC